MARNSSSWQRTMVVNDKQQEQSQYITNDQNYTFFSLRILVYASIRCPIETH
ncbi:unnamed protein product [Penicillium camemberti]|uniref:Str. FM013 n=1 Tax=Penicillium camemberti (strain FM 013) TaxID=1429867 RepID=A0A0G4PY80_PENC3|nr:unnamed protein product [Penicillium camemberti]